MQIPNLVDATSIEELSSQKKASNSRGLRENLISGVEIGWSTRTVFAKRCHGFGAGPDSILNQGTGG